MSNLKVTTIKSQIPKDPLLYPSRISLSLTNKDSIALLLSIQSPPAPPSALCKSSTSAKDDDGYVYCRENSLECKETSRCCHPGTIQTFYFDESLSLSSGRRLSRHSTALDLCCTLPPLTPCYRCCEFCLGAEGEYVEVRSTPKVGGKCLTRCGAFPWVTVRGCGGKAVRVRVFDGRGTRERVERMVMEGRGRLVEG